MTTRPCPLCGGASALVFKTGDRNQETTQEAFSYLRCSSCRVLFLADPPEDLAPYYGEAYYDLSSLDRIDELANAEQYRLDFVRRHVPEGRLVDVGAGGGAFAHLARRAGYDVTAIEMDPRSCDHLRRVIQVRTIETSAPESALAQAPPSDAVTLWHVLEHVRKPLELLEAAADSLRPSGILVIATPNPEAFQFRVLGSRWPHVDAPRHLFLFPAELLTERGREMGLECVELTSCDKGARILNEFGWAHAFSRPGARGLAARGILAGARVATLALGRVESRGLRGAAYTAVLRKAG